jgi:outer membrane immunogenic protein
LRGKSIVFAAVAMLTATGHLIAADLPMPSLPAPLPAAVYNWTGFYPGINGGFGDGNSNGTDGAVGETARFPISGYLVGVGSTVSFNESIVRAGINFKFGPW